jgi:hypothetical protein
VLCYIFCVLSPKTNDNAEGSVMGSLCWRRNMLERLIPKDDKGCDNYYYCRKLRNCVIFPVCCHTDGKDNVRKTEY